MKGSDIGIHEKKSKLFNEWERFTSTDGESIESYYHHFSKLMNDFKRNKHFPEKIASNLKFLNNLQPEWSRHVTIVHQTKDLHTTDYTQLYDVLKYNQKEMVRGNGGNQFRQYAGQNVGNQVVQNAVQNPGVQNVRNQNGVIVVPGIANQNGNGNVVAARAESNVNGNNVRPRRRDASYLQTQLLIVQKEEAGIQLQAEEFDLMAAAADLDEIVICNKHQHRIFNMFTQEEQYTELLEPILEPHQVPQNDSNVISEVSSVEQGGGIVEQHSANVEEIRVYHESLFHNLAVKVEKVNLVNRKMKEKNAELTTELARYKNQERCFEIRQEKYDKLERCKQITALNEEISNLNKHLSKEKSTVSSLQEEKKRLKYDFKIREDELLDKQIQLENKVKELDNILVKKGQSIQTMHMLSPKPDSFYHTEHKIALGYQNPFYLKQAQQKQQSLYNGKVLLEKHDPSSVYDSEETLELAQESRLKMK
ncbi:hypothetical protein Tco_0434983 [Tanacetum coccineum]